MENGLCRGLGVKESWALLGWRLRRGHWKLQDGAVGRGWPHPGLLSQLLTVSSEPAGSRGSGVTNTSCQTLWHEEEGSNLGLLSFLWSFYNPVLAPRTNAPRRLCTAGRTEGHRLLFPACGCGAAAGRRVLPPGPSPRVPGGGRALCRGAQEDLPFAEDFLGVQMVPGTSIMLPHSVQPPGGTVLPVL